MVRNLPSRLILAASIQFSLRSPALACLLHTAIALSAVEGPPFAHGNTCSSLHGRSPHRGPNPSSDLRWHLPWQARFALVASSSGNLRGPLPSLGAFGLGCGHSSTQSGRTTGSGASRTHSGTAGAPAAAVVPTAFDRPPHVSSPPENSGADAASSVVRLHSHAPARDSIGTSTDAT